MELTKEFIEDLKEQVFEEVIQYGNGETVCFDTLYENNPINVFVQYKVIISSIRKGYEKDGVGRWESADVLYRCKVEVLEEDDAIAHFECEFEDSYYTDDTM